MTKYTKDQKERLEQLTRKFSVQYPNSAPTLAKRELNSEIRKQEEREKAQRKRDEKKK